MQKNKHTNTQKLKLAYNSYISELNRLPKNNVRLIWSNYSKQFNISVFFSDNSIIKYDNQIIL